MKPFKQQLPIGLLHSLGDVVDVKVSIDWRNSLRIVGRDTIEVSAIIKVILLLIGVLVGLTRVGRVICFIGRGSYSLSNLVSVSSV